MVSVSAQTLHFLENEEGCKLHAYQDSRGIWTIGVGMTQLRGRPVKAGDTLTQTEADNFFKTLVVATQSEVLRLISVPLNPNQITALISLAYNIGVSAFSTSTVRRKLNTRDYTGAADAFLSWKRAGNDTNRLLPRRQRERSLFLK